MAVVIGESNMDEQKSVNAPDYEKCEEEARKLFSSHCKEVRRITRKYWGSEHDDYRHKLQKELKEKFFRELKELRKKYNIPEPVNP